MEAFFDEIEKEVKPQIQPFYTTSCPRGHQGHWIDVRINQAANVDPLSLTSEDRKNYRWKGPEVIYTFWAKHGPCDARGCDHRTPLFKSLIIAQKTMTTNYLELTCPECGEKFHAELGESRMAPGVELLCADADESAFSATSQDFANLLNDYDKGTAQDTIDRWEKLNEMTANEPGLRCPHCHAFAGKTVQDVLQRHVSSKASERKKKAFNIKKKKVQLWLLISPKWAKGVSGKDENGNEYGGYAEASPDITAAWNNKWLENLALIEIRSKKEPESFFWQGETIPANGTVPRKAHFTCNHCGRENNTLESVRPTHHTATVAEYALQCLCSQCEAGGYNYNKAPDANDIRILNAAETEWATCSEQDLHDYWPHEICWDALHDAGKWRR